MIAKSKKIFAVTYKGQKEHVLDLGHWPAKMDFATS